MITRLRRTLRIVTRHLWFRAGLFSLGAVLAALLAKQVDGYLPGRVPFPVSIEAVASILGALASSLLAVTIFSLSTLVSALSTAADAATPRARPLLQTDRTSLHALSTFLGAFLFSLVALMALRTGYYGDRGRFVLFLATLVMVVVVVVTLLQWIHHVSRLGGLIETTSRVEAATHDALVERAREPFLGAAAPHPGGIPDDARAICSDAVGYLQHIDVAALQTLANDVGGSVHLVRLPGAFVTARTPVAFVAVGAGSATATDLTQRVRDAMTVDQTRAFDQDPRFGLIVLSEIASRALSPAVNDPGTAIDVIGRCVRLLLRYRPDIAGEPTFPAVHAPALAPQDMIEDCFGPIARDGAGRPGVAIRLQKALQTVACEADPGFTAPALAMSAYALDQARGRLPDADLERIVAQVQRGVESWGAIGPSSGSGNEDERGH
ncbi:DUF2254 domain-containing protein [Lysobacter niabensis]|uniref:DUF2254 domain-containing protein n=1 Tax=Agrilutibacter niabensis TaxID=380628 RepID=UPI0036155F08